MTTTSLPTSSGLAEVGLLHEVDAVVDALEVRARDVERDRVHRAGRDRDRVEVALELVERDVDADRRVEDERDAEPLDEPDVHLDRLARQAERRHADEHRAAAVRQAVEDRDLVALHRELAGDRQAGRPGADHRDPLVARRDLGHDVRDARTPRATRRGTASSPGSRAAGRCRRGGRPARTAPSRRTSTSPRPGSARATGCSPPRTGPRRRGSGSRGSSSRPGTLPGTRCCTGARTRRRAERGIPGRVDGQAGRAFPWWFTGSGADGTDRRAPTRRNLPSALRGARAARDATSGRS